MFKYALFTRGLCLSTAFSFPTVTSRQSSSPIGGLRNPQTTHGSVLVDLRSIYAQIGSLCQYCQIYIYIYILTWCAIMFARKKAIIDEVGMAFNHSVNFRQTYSNHHLWYFIFIPKELEKLDFLSVCLNKDCLMKLFNAFIISNFNYSSIVWHFCPRESTSKVEKIHKSALRIVLNDYKSNYDTLLQLSYLQPLLISRLKAILYEVYKCTREINPSFMNELFSKIIHPYRTRSGSMLTQPRASSIKYGINNFVFQGAKLWNSLPASAKGLENPYDFKSFLE